MYYFGKTKSKKKTVGLLPAPEVAGATEFGRYLRYGRRSLFGRRYFGFGSSCSIPQNMGSYNFGNDMNRMNKLYFGKGAGRKKKITAAVEEESVAAAFGRRYNFGRRRKSTRKGKKPTKALIKSCRRYRIKVTRKVGKKKVYKSITLLKRLLKRKKKNVKKKTTRKKTRRTRRRNRFSMFGR